MLVDYNDAPSSTFSDVCTVPHVVVDDVDVLKIFSSKWVQAECVFLDFSHTVVVLASNIAVHVYNITFHGPRGVQMYPQRSKNCDIFKST